LHSLQAQLVATRLGISTCWCEEERGERNGESIDSIETWSGTCAEVWALPETSRLAFRGHVRSNGRMQFMCKASSRSPIFIPTLSETICYCHCFRPETVALLKYHELDGTSSVDAPWPPGSISYPEPFARHPSTLHSIGNLLESNLSRNIRTAMLRFNIDAEGTESTVIGSAQLIFGDVFACLK
jgi:hypothetical protein